VHAVARESVDSRRSVALAGLSAGHRALQRGHWSVVDTAAAAADVTSHLPATPRDAVDREQSRLAAQQPRTIQRTQRFSLE